MVSTIYTAHLAHGPWWAETVDCEPPTYRNWGMVKEGMRAALNRVSQMSRMHSFEQTRNRFTLSADIHTTVQRGNVWSFHMVYYPLLICTNSEDIFISYYCLLGLLFFLLFDGSALWKEGSTYTQLILVNSPITSRKKLTINRFYRLI